MPYKEKEDQAAFLKSAADYIKQLQVWPLYQKLLEAEYTVNVQLAGADGCSTLSTVAMLDPLMGVDGLTPVIV